jgi:DNA-binding beta-propeller fold protein YncE
MAMHTSNDIRFMLALPYLMRPFAVILALLVAGCGRTGDPPPTKTTEIEPTLVLGGYVDLPAHRGDDGFDHADVHPTLGRVYLAHTANDSLEILDAVADQHIGTIDGLTGVAGVLVAPELDLVFTSNRGEDTVGILSLAQGAAVREVAVAGRPNGLALDPERRLLLVGHRGPPASVTVIDVAAGEVRSTIEVPGRTRWMVFDPQQEMFFVNIAEPAQIVGIDAQAPDRIARTFDVPAAGPHGLALDTKERALLCACDAAKLVRLDAQTGALSGTLDLSGGPDVVFLDADRRRLYVAVGDPGVIDVVDVDAMQLVETVATEKGAHTLAFDATRGKVYAFLPETHRAAVFTIR